MVSFRKRLIKAKDICDKYEKLIPDYPEGDMFFSLCDELMNMGFLLDMEYTGSRVRNPAVKFKNSGTDIGDFTSQLYVLERK